MQAESSPNGSKVVAVREGDSHLIPSRGQAIEFSWNSSIARNRGIHGFNSFDSRSRSFNLIRARIFGLRRKRGWRMLGFVSASPSVGKSFISANVAAALSRDPRSQTYLVDLDLRRGGIGSIFDIAPQEGLESFLDSSEWHGPPPAYTPTGQSLIILPAVPGHQVSSAELLVGTRAVQLLQAMRNSPQANLFLFDLPPVFANDDTSAVMELLDGYVLIAEEGKTTQRDIESAVDMLGEERLAGVILNKYRGGLISEGRGIEDYYAAGYYLSESDSPEAQNPADS